MGSCQDAVVSALTARPDLGALKLDERIDLVTWIKSMQSCLDTLNPTVLRKELMHAMQGKSSSLKNAVMQRYAIVLDWLNENKSMFEKRVKSYSKAEQTHSQQNMSTSADSVRTIGHTRTLSPR